MIENPWARMPGSIPGPTQPLATCLAKCEVVRRLPVLRAADPLYIFSDFGGEHDGVQFNTYSFFLYDPQQSRAALQAIRDVRAKFLNDKYSLDFKKIRPGGRLNALEPFWTAVRQATAVCVTIIVDRDLGTLVRRRSHAATSDLDADLLSRVSKLSDIPFDHLYRVLHIVALLLMGTTAPGQPVYWIIDQDKLVESPEAREILTATGRNLVEQYAPDCGPIDIYVDSNRPVDDLKSLLWVPDQLAGAWCEYLSDQHKAVTGHQLTAKTGAILRGSTASAATFRSIAISLRDISDPKALGYAIECDSARGAMVL